MRIRSSREGSRDSSRSFVITSLSKVAVMTVAMASTALALSPIASAQNSNRFQRYSEAGSFKPAQMPLGVNQKERVTVVVQMSSDPVAVARALAPDHKISQAQHDAIRDRIAQEHAAIEPEIIARGGKVLAKFHSALNGVKAEISRDQIAGLQSASGVKAVLGVRKYHPVNAESVPFIGAPLVWQGTPAFKGEGAKIASIDTGIDYTHANFGGPGTVAAFNAAFATSTQPADPTLFGPNAPKVKGGIDLVGDAYNADVAGSTPMPDPNPLDCNGHGSHTAGTAAGFGVANDGTTYKGPYDSAAYTTGFLIGPGVAPKADLYAVRVFGCNGSTNVVVDAIDWAIENNMDVITMSLGSDFGTAADADAIASTNATRAGVIVAAASGNAGPAPYITSTPAVSAEAISVAAIDSHQTFPGALVALDDGSIEAQDSNGAPLPGPMGVVVLRNADGSVSLGCNESEYVDSVITGKLVVTVRGSCARVLRAQLGQKHGAAAVAMINNAAGYPVYEGVIAGVTIPFLGVLPSDQATLTGATAVTSYTANTIANPNFRTAASFSSGGPRFGDSLLKPNVAAPGVSIFSTASGTGNGGLYESGTSMATPHVAGVAALTKQAHPDWDERARSAAVVETADPAQLLDYAPAIEGAGLVQAVGATQTQAVVFAEGAGGQHAISFGFDESTGDFHMDRELTVRNFGNKRVRFNVTSTQTSAVPHTVHLSRTSIGVDGHDNEDMDISLAVPASTVGGTHDNSGNLTFPEVAGYLTFTPADPSMNGGVSLHVPYYFVPRARSSVFAQQHGHLSAKHPTANVQVTNTSGSTTGNADFYALGLTGAPQGIKYFDTRAVGVQTNPISATDSILVFAINTFDRFSTAAGGEFDILIDVNGDGVPDFDLAGVDLGALTAGSANGVFVSALINLKTKAATIKFLADAPTDGSIVELPVLASDLGITPSNPRFSYTETTFNNLDGTQSSLPGVGYFNAFTPSLAVSASYANSNVLPVPVAPNSSQTVPVSFNATEAAQTPSLGLMVVVEDNKSGEREATLIQSKD